MNRWTDTFKSISASSAEFGSDFGLGVIDLIPPKKPPPYVPSDPNPPTIDRTFGGFTFQNPFAATPGLSPEEQKVKDKALLVKVALGGAGLLALLAILSGPKPVSTPTATAPTPRPGNISINLERFSPFHRKRAKK